MIELIAQIIKLGTKIFTSVERGQRAKSLKTIRKILNAVDEGDIDTINRLMPRLLNQPTRARKPDKP